jgi:tetratricopeptide (TPR) repeat protein
VVEPAAGRHNVAARALRSIVAGASFAALLSLTESVPACGWSWETYAAEAKALPCVHDALVGYFPKHGDAYHRAVIAAVDYGASWAPAYTAGLDAKGLALMHLGHLEEAKRVMLARLAAAPNAYPTHANLGTLYTFTGEYEKALAHVDRAMDIEPKAHFGREKYHRKLVEYLRDVKADPNVRLTHTFLGVAPSPADRTLGSKARYEKAGFQDDAIDALVSMIAVYGAESLADIYLTLGELLALRGYPKLAWTAYKRASELGHPREKDLGYFRSLVLSTIKTPDARERRRVGGLEVFEDRPGGHYGLPEFYAGKRHEANGMRAEFVRWEERQLKKGLAVWTQAGIQKIYERMNQVRTRCPVPSLIDSERAEASPDGGLPSPDAGTTAP